jgi:Holliday junction resolvase RusA-like endonuclease
MHTITVPTIPSVNHYVKHTKRGGHYKVKAVKEFIKRVCGQLLYALLPEWTFFSFKEKKPLRLMLEFTLKENLRRRDLDNMLKVVIDCLAESYNFKDSYIDFLIAQKRINKDMEVETIKFQFLDKECVDDIVEMIQKRRNIEND